MPRLPIVNAQALVRALHRAGFQLKRKSGSHAIYKHDDGRFANVPMHPGDLKRGTLKAILEAAGLSVEELQDLL